jgi:acyl-CoA synthetase (AMP-forming)/AMP-acid ligase II
MSDLFEIVEEDVRGTPTRVFKGAPPSLRAVWLASAVHDDKTFLVYKDERYSFAESHRIVNALAQRLGIYGVQPGDRVAIAMRNYPEWAFAFWAAISVGAVVVPLNAWWTGPELAYGLSDSGSVVLFADEERAERLAPLLGQTAVRQVVLARTERYLPNAETFADALGDLDVAALANIDVEPDDDATIMYTSGTTGKPKGAVATHRNFMAFLMNLMYRQTMAAVASPPPADAPPALPPATLLTFPLFHVGGLQSALLVYTAIGGKIVLMYKWDADEAIDLIEREDVTAVAGVPTTMFELLEVAHAQGRELSSLASVASGATLVPPELVRRIDSQLASRAAPTNGYGLTETSGAAIANGGKAYVDRPDSVGTVIAPVIEVKIVGPDGDDLATGEVGEIWLKGPTVVRGYFNDPEATAAAFRDGWFATGDLGRLDAEGYLYVVDRLKDVIIRGGENIYAAEVEAALYEHPEVTEAAIIGIPNEQLGEEVGAVVRVRDDVELSEDDVRDHVRARLASFKVPTRVWITKEELPRNAAGKVLKRELRETLAVD